MRILLDSNVWRYLIDGDGVAELRNAVRRSKHSLVVAPALLFEATRTTDKRVRTSLITAMIDRTWKRLMPEAFSEAEEFKCEVRRLRPEWLRAHADLVRFKRFRFDWRRSQGGVWDRILADVDRLQRLEQASGMLKAARLQSREHRGDAMAWSPKWKTTPLRTIRAVLPDGLPGWDGTPVEPWRFDAWNVLLRELHTPNHPAIDWIEGDIDIPRLLSSHESHVKFWLHDVDLVRMPRYWLRWAFEFLQRQHRITDGSPVDCQIGTYLLDVDLMLSADKLFVSMAERCRSDAPFAMAESKKVPGGPPCVESVLAVISAR